MITAGDTSVLLDMFTADRTFGPPSRDTLGACLAVGTVLTEAAMTALGAAFNPLERRSAGQAWRSYRERGGSSQRVIADLLIGAHASLAYKPSAC